MKELELVARCAGGFESVLARELTQLSFHRVRPLRGTVAFFGGLRDAYRACLWSRVATRIQLVLARVPAKDAEELYQSAVCFPWEKHVRDGATVAVRAHGVNAELRNTQFTALKVKDALCDRLREVRGARPDVNAKQPDFAVDVALHENRATLSLNLSGESLHRRGWREDGVQTEAPLKETLAAGILLSAGWDTLAEEGGVLVDPMCGSGTFAVEGALIAAGIAPGALRARWGFEGWVRHTRELWDEVLEEALALREGAYTSARIIAGDRDANAVAIAQANAERAGVAEFIRFHVDDAARLSRHLHGVKGARGLLAANPPYGLRLLSQSELPQVHDALATAIAAVPADWQAALITPDLGIDTALGKQPDRVISCYNGPIETWVRLYDAVGSGIQTHEVVSLSGKQHNVRIADPGSAQFAGRLRKVAKQRARWAKNEGIACYRMYDADLPDYPLSVDFFQGAGAHAGSSFAVIEERPRARSVDVQRAGRHFADAVAFAATTLDVPLANIVQKPWATDSLYERTREVAPEQLVCIAEGDYVFHADLMGAVGKTLPLELRALRTWIGEHAEGKRFANLFASGNAATVYAAGGGASSTVTVDASKERLDWTMAALDDNHLAGKLHRAVRMDVRDWIDRESKAKHRYDLVLCSPPSRLAAHGSAASWDLARDLHGLLERLERILAPSGEILLVLPAGAAAPGGVRLAVTELSAQLTPPDFERAREHPVIFLLG